MELNGKVAWVVGASSGIGAAVARELARRGGTVAISARRDEQLREVSGGHMLVVPLDVTDAASAAAAAARVHQELGPIDLAVLSAGYWKQMNPQDWDTEVFDQHIRVNLTGMSNSIAAVLPGMLARRAGSIVTFASPPIRTCVVEIFLAGTHTFPRRMYHESKVALSNIHEGLFAGSPITRTIAKSSMLTHTFPR